MSELGWTIRHVDLAEGPQNLVAGEAGGVFVVLWWRRLLLGVKPLLREELPFDGQQMLDLGAQFAAEQLQARTGLIPRAGVDARPHRRLQSPDPAAAPLEDLDRLAAPDQRSATPLSVVICTRDRPAMLASCLDSLAAQTSPPGQIVVVDNDPGASARGVAAGRTGVVYVHEPRPGLSIARNAGLGAARGALIAFTDDDVELPPTWTSEVVRAFDDPEVDAVTGAVLPASLDTAAQRAFELELGGFTGRCTPLRFDPGFIAETREMGPQVWRIGAGANMAFRRKGLAGLGGFDERLGAGASGCSEDSEYWYRLLAAGRVCLYEPRAVVFHHHRRDWPALRRQYRAYMRGHVAALVAQADRYGNRGDLRRIYRQLPMYFLRTGLAAVQNLSGWRLRLLIEEIIGWLQGLSYLARPGWRMKRTTVPVTPGAAGAGQSLRVEHA
jgi:glycosyltransferase involved in cell wall biosynthesis